MGLIDLETTETILVPAHFELIIVVGWMLGSVHCFVF